MAFGSEIRFKIGGDTTALSKAFVQAQSVAATAALQIRKKFELKGAFNGLLQGIGIGSIDAVANAVVRPFALAYERARETLSLTARLRDQTMRGIMAGGSRDAGVRVRQQEIKDLNRDIEDQQRLVDDLASNPLTYVSPRAMELLSEARKELDNLRVRQVELITDIEVEEKTRKRVVQEMAREQSRLDEMHAANLRGAGDREKMQLRLNQLQEEYVRLQREGNGSTPATSANYVEQRQLRRRMELLEQEARSQLADTVAGLGAGLLGQSPDRVPAPRPRGRSEAERIADRGRSFAMQAEEAARTGRSPDFVARLAAAGARDLRTAGAKMSNQISKVDEDDANVLGSELLKTNELLDKIRANLTPTKPGSGASR